jgi:1,4-dihydroxy-2-naphthoyl-CoA synthase
MTSSYETIRLDTDARGVARLVLNRPDKHNALNAVIIRELTDQGGNPCCHHVAASRQTPKAPHRNC